MGALSSLAMSAYCPTSLYKHQYICGTREQLGRAGGTSEAKWRVFCWTSGVSPHGRVFGHEPRRDWPAQTGPQNSSFAGFASSSQGLFSALATGAES